MRRIDDLQLNGLKIIQDTEQFCFGSDAVCLANFVVEKTFIKAETQILDFCTGGGVIPLLLAGKTDCENITGVEIQEKSAVLAQENVELNNLQKRVKVLHDDLKNVKGKFDIITCNPPYKPKNSGLSSCNENIAVARTEIKIELEEIIEKASELLIDRGKFFLVHKPERLVEIFVLMNKYNLEPKRFQPVYFSMEKSPVLILIESVKNGGKHLTYEPCLWL